jgi:outer membrane receptor protein involved in Fe transport
MLRLSHRLWRRDLNEMASGKPGAVHGPNGVTLGVFGKNLGDVRQVASFQDNYNGNQPTEWAAPRTYGVSVGYKF